MGEDENKIECLVGVKEERNNFKKWWDPYFYYFLSLYLLSLHFFSISLEPNTFAFHFISHLFSFYLLVSILLISLFSTKNNVYNLESFISDLGGFNKTNIFAM